MAKPTYTTWELDPTWAHFANILSAVPFSENTGTPLDLIGANTVTDTGCVWTTADGSGAIAFAKDADGDVLGVDIVVPTPGTIILIYDPGSGFAGSADSAMGSTTSNSYGMRRASGSTIMQWGATGVISTNMGTGWYTTSADQVIILTCDTTGASNESVADVGAAQYTGAGDDTANAGDFRIQQGFGVADNGLQALGWVLLDDKLTTTEAASVRAAPWGAFREAGVGGGRIMSSLAGHGGLAGKGGIAGTGGGLAG